MSYPRRFVLAITLMCLAGSGVAPVRCGAQTEDDARAALDRLSELVDQNEWVAAEAEGQRALIMAERALAKRPGVLAEFCAVVGDVYVGGDRQDMAEPLFSRAVDLERRVNARSEKLVARLRKLGDCQYAQSKYEAAIESYGQALELAKRVLGDEHLDTAGCWRDVAWCYYDLGDYAQAEEYFAPVVEIRRAQLGNDDELTVNSLREWANSIYYQGRYADALEAYDEALQASISVFGDSHAEVARLWYDKADSLSILNRYEEAEAAYRRSSEIYREVLGDTAKEIGPVERGLGHLLIELGRYDEAEACFRKALEVEERAFGGQHDYVARGLEGLANIRHSLGRYAEAEPLYLRILRIREQLDNELDLAVTCLNLANNYMAQDRYAEAERLARRTLAIRLEQLEPDDPLVAAVMNDLGAILRTQGRDKEAVPLYRRALEIREEVLRDDHPDLATSLMNLGNVEADLENFDTADEYYQRAYAILEKAYGEGHVELSHCISRIGDLHWKQGHYDDALARYTESFAILERHWGPVHPNLAMVLYDLAWCYYRIDDSDECVRLMDRAINIDRQAPVGPYTAHLLYFLRARALREAGRSSDAVRDLERALKLAEESRRGSSGAELERAMFFARFGAAFEQMVAWQMEDGNVEKALEAMERARARSLLDEIGMLGVDLDAGRPLEEEQQLEESTREVRERLARLEGEVERLIQRGAASQANETRLAELKSEIAQARQEQYEQYRDARASSRIYQQLATSRDRIPPMGDIQRQLLSDRSLMLVYMLGENHGYVIAITQDDSMLFQLRVGDDDAPLLGIESGAFGESQARTALLSDAGLMRELSNPRPSAQLSAKLELMWRILIPEEYHDAITSGEIEHLHIIPHGSLSFLPFEPLVVSLDEGRPRYLIDVGPPIDYAPSVSVLHSLRIRAARHDAEAFTALTLGNPSYGVPSGAELAEENTRSVVLRSHLTPLPFTGRESRQVEEVLNQAGVKTVRLVETEATEGNVRREVRGRGIIHLACHGFADQAHGNLFGSLALSIGQNGASDPGDDGFLTLGEIYDLDLRGCELAILSACQTNYGPEQEGEGVWTLSRGFLVAGARRVVASNWVVDDAATAQLVTQFCAELAQRLEADREHAYAEALLAAKRQVRSQPRWAAPFYWASMVVVGPR